MKTLRQLSIVLLILSVGQILQTKFNLFIPGTILGMMILLILLLTKIIKLKWIENITNVLLDHISIFFVPANVGVMVYLSQIKDVWAQILFIAIVSTVVVMGVTGAVVQLIDRLMARSRKEGNA
ncbi:MAG TPA: CidA/LrgA family protein [Tissierellia bacterium]|nr:CidA/LrgA family protein [Tissierellia bacterium]